MNVIITRAKSLLIIVGDPCTLAVNPNWAKLIKYCGENNALIDKDPEQVQEKPKIRAKTPVRKRILQKAVFEIKLNHSKQ